MADLKISQLTAISVLTPATDVLPVVDVGGVTKKITTNQILGSGGTATLASAAITGAATVGTTLGVTGVSTFAAGTVSLPALTTTGDTNTGIYYPAADTFAVTTGGTERYRVDSAGNVGIGVTPSAGKGALQLSSGINFPATQVASSDANTLDDYEEGNWTGTVKGSVSDPTVPLTVSGKYTKIGRMVQVTVDYSNVSTVGASGNISISGLPFTSANDGAGSIGAAGFYLAGTFTGYATSTILSNSSVIQFFWSQSAGVNGAVTHNAGVGRYINTTLVYHV